MDLTTLIDALGTRNTDTYNKARNQIRQLGSAVIPTLVQTMLDDSGILSWRAATLLAEIKVSVLLEHSVKALESSSPMVRQLVVQVICENGDQRFIGPLLNHLRDSSCLVQLWAVEALGIIGDNTVVDPLLELLHETNSQSIQLSVIQALGRIGEARATEGLRPFLQSDDSHVRSRTQRIYNQLLASSREN